MTLVYTIGHSTRPIEAFIELLKLNEIDRLLDVRTVPRSRHNPQFDQALLPGSLQNAAIDYHHVPALGGLRRPRPDSKNTGWRNTSFRGYADYMQTDPFKSAIDALVGTAQKHRCVVMCAEAVPWRCHRSLIADALLVRQLEVAHIMGPQQLKPHVLTSFAKVNDTDISYPPEIEQHALPL